MVQPRTIAGPRSGQPWPWHSHRHVAARRPEQGEAADQLGAGRPNAVLAAAHRTGDLAASGEAAVAVPKRMGELGCWAAPLTATCDTQIAPSSRSPNVQAVNPIRAVTGSSGAGTALSKPPSSTSSIAKESCRPVWKVDSYPTVSSGLR